MHWEEPKNRSHVPTDGLFHFQVFTGWIRNDKIDFGTTFLEYIVSENASSLSAALTQMMSTVVKRRYFEYYVPYIII